MLRLPATKIDIGSRDLVWHIDRYQQRKAQYEQETRARNQLARAYPSVQDGLNKKLACHTQHEQLYRQHSVRDTNNDALVFNKPVPENLSAFWDSVMAIAGTSVTNAEPLPHEPEVQTAASPSTSLSSHHNMSLSYSSNDLQRYTQDWQSYRSDDISQDLHNIATRGSELASQESGSSEASIQLSAAENLEEVVQASKVEHDYDLPTTTKSRNYFTRFRYPGHDGGEENDLSTSFSSQLDLDGPNDVVPEIMGPSHVSKHPGTMSGATFDREGYHTSGCIYPSGPQRSTTSPQRDYEANLDVSSFGIGFQPDDEPTLPALPLYKSIERLRSRSGGLPRSPLYVSQAAASSSPDKYNNTVPSTVDQNDLQVSSLLSQPPRRPKNIQAQREACAAAALERQWQPYPRAYVHEVQVDILERFPTPKNNSNPVSHNLSDNGIHSPLSAAALSAISDFVNSPYSTVHSSPPLIPAQGSSPSYTHNQQALPSYTSSRHSIPTATSSPPLPPPFSATRRLMSFDLTRPSSSSPNAYTSPTRPSPTPSSSSPDPGAGPASPFRNPSSMYQPPIEPHLISTPPPNTPHRSMRVYNDTLPASSQPQTPVGLPRHGVPAMGPLDRGAFTAPVGTRASSRHHWGRVGGESPSRAGRGASRWGRNPSMAEEQENLAGFVVAEMRRDREARGGEVVEAGELLRTPPRGPRGEGAV